VRVSVSVGRWTTPPVAIRVVHRRVSRSVAHTLTVSSPHYVHQHAPASSPVLVYILWRDISRKKRDERRWRRPICFSRAFAAIQNNGSSGPGRLYVHRTIITSKNHMFMWKNISICPQDKAYYSYECAFVSSNYSTSRGDMSAPTTITNCDKSPARYRSISTRQNLNYFSSLIGILDVVKRNLLFLHEIEWKNNGFLFTTPNMIRINF